MRQLRISTSSQTAIEFVIIVGAMFLFFSIIFLTLQENMLDKTRERQNILAENIATLIQNEINLAHESREGYQREFSIPTTILDEEYELRIPDNMVYIKTSNNKTSLTLPIQPVIGNILKGKNRIRKENGTVYLNQ